MEGHLQPSSAFSSTSSASSFQQHQHLQARLQRPSALHQYSAVIDQRHLLGDSAFSITTNNILSASINSSHSPTPGVLVHAASLLKQENRDSPFDPHSGGSYSVDRLLQQQATNVVDAKPTISPALLSAVDLVSSNQDPLQALHQRQQEQLAVAQQYLTSSLLTPSRTVLLHERGDSPLAGLHSSLQPLLNTPPPPVIGSPQLQHRPSLPQLNSLVRNIDRRLLISPPVICGTFTPTSQQRPQNFVDSRLFRRQELPENQQQQLNRFAVGASSNIVSPRSLSPSPSSCGGSEQQNAALELASIKDEGGSHYQAGTVSPLRGRGRPSTNPILDGSPRQHPCPECGKAFPNNSALVKHRLIHSDERNFVCTICQKAFKRQDHLNGHLNVHKTVKPFPCIIGNCDKSYCDARSLRRHLEHSHNVQNPVVHSSKGTVYIKCDDLEATVVPNRIGEEGQPIYNPAETSSGSTIPGQEFAPDPEAYSGQEESPESDHPQLDLVSPTLGLEGRRSSSKPVECGQCGRTFKNMPALNGHMRLHSVSGRGESTPRSFDDMNPKGMEQTSMPVYAQPPVGSVGHSGHSSSAPGSTPNTGTSPVDAILQQQRHQHALAQALTASESTSASYQRDQREQNLLDYDYNMRQEFRPNPNRPGPGLLMYAPSQQRPGLPHQQQHGLYHVSDAQVQTVHDYASPMSSRPPSRSSTHTTAYMAGESKQHDIQQQHQHNHGYASLLTVNTSSLQDPSGGNESMLSGSDDPTMMSPHLGSLTGLDVSASPDLTMKPTTSGAGGTSNMPSAPMLAGPAVVDSPYCSNLRSEDLDVHGQRDFGFPGSYSGVEMPASSGDAHMDMHTSSHHMQSSMGASSGASCHMEGPLDLGPELSKDVDDELIQKELLSFMRFPGPGDGLFNPFMNDDEEMLFSPAKLTERKRHMTAPSALALGNGGYSATSHFPGSSVQNDHQYNFHHHQQSSSSSYSGYASSKPGSILNNYEQSDMMSMNMAADELDGQNSAAFMASPSGSGGMGHPLAALSGQNVSGFNNSIASTSGNGKKSRPVSRQRRKSRGKPDNVFMLLKSVGLRRSFNLPISPPRFRKHSAIGNSDTGRKFSAGNGMGGGGGTSTKCHHRSGGSLHQRHANRPKPAPLLIPGATLNRFHSQLRSPRLWIGGGLSAAYPKSGYSTPTPYTPPPILSPVRHGSGLFWTIRQAVAAAFAGPKSAPISPRFCREFWSRALPPAAPPTDSQGGQAVHTAVSAQVTAANDNTDDGTYSGIVANNNSRVVSPLGLGVTEDEDGQPPATDTTPHINIGSHYQADIPEILNGRIGLDAEPDKADLLFDPATCQNLDDTEMDAFCKVASSAVMNGCGRNVEYAVHLLHAVNGDLEKAYFTLLSPEIGQQILASTMPQLSNYEYVDTCLWSSEEIMKFQEAILKHDKDFFVISSAVATKSVKQCVQFYYTWKKICTDEYKRLRAARRRRILPAMALEPNVYDLRSMSHHIETVVPTAAVGSPFMAASRSDQDTTAADYEQRLVDDLESNQRDANYDELDDFVAPSEKSGLETGAYGKTRYENETETPIAKTYNGSPYRSSPAIETGSASETIFPCRLCGKVFHKVKSRNAHMKSHSTSASSKKGSPAPPSVASVP